MFQHASYNFGPLVLNAGQNQRIVSLSRILFMNRINKKSESTVTTMEVPKQCTAVKEGTMNTTIFSSAPPEEPTESDCCQSGCNPCVFDLYEIRLAQWKKNMLSDRKSNVRYDLLSDIKFKPFVLLEKINFTSDLYLLKFQPSINCNQVENVIDGVLPYNPGQHFILKTTSEYYQLNSDNIELHNKVEKVSLPNSVINENQNMLVHEEKKFLSRAYTPITLSTEEKNCCFNIVIKLYYNGAMSEFVRTLIIGDVVYFRGPYGSFHYTPNKHKIILMICMGTGVAPMFTVIKNILHDESDETMVQLLYGCKTVDDIIMRNEISKFSSYWNFTVNYYISKTLSDHKSTKRFGENFVYSKIDENELSALKFNKDDCMVLICGSDEFSDSVLNTFLKLGLEKDNIHVF